MAVNNTLTLLSNASATGSAVAWPGGAGAVSAEGTFGGATLTLQAYSANGTAVSTTVTFTAAGWGTFTLPPCRILMAVSGGTPSALYAYAHSTNNP